VGTFHLAVDLGRVRDFTALAVLEVVPPPPIEVYDGFYKVEMVPSKKPPALHIRHLERVKKGTTYPKIVSLVQQRLAAITNVNSTPSLVIDRTGVGVALQDLFEEAGLQPIGITITGGDAITWEGRHVKVPKRELVTSVHVAMQTGRLKFAEELPELQTLIDELGAFDYTISSTGHDTYGNDWRQNAHDDLVLAVSLAVFYAEKMYVRPWTKEDLKALSHGMPV
jgi:hypothetical protein